MPSDLRARVQARLAKLNLGPVQAATSVQLERTFIRDIVKENGKTTVTARMMPKLALALKTTAAYLNGETDDPELPGGEPEVRPSTGILTTVPLVGYTKAGDFREVLEFEDPEREFLLEEVDDEFPRAKMVAFVIEGDSMNAASPPIWPGSRVICVDFEDTGLPLLDGMTVVLERTRNGGLTREWSVKEVEAFEDRVEYHPRSTNPKHEPIVVPYDADPNDGTRVSVLALVRRISTAIPKNKPLRR